MEENNKRQPEQDIQEPVRRRVTKMAYPKVRHFHLGMGD